MEDGKNIYKKENRLAWYKKYFVAYVRVSYDGIPQCNTLYLYVRELPNIQSVFSLSDLLGQLVRWIIIIHLTALLSLYCSSLIYHPITFTGTYELAIILTLLPMCGFIAQVMGSNHIEALNFFRLLLCKLLLNCKHNCEDYFFTIYTLSSVHNYRISFILYSVVCTLLTFLVLSSFIHSSKYRPSVSLAN